MWETGDDSDIHQEGGAILWRTCRHDAPVCLSIHGAGEAGLSPLRGRASERGEQHWMSAKLSEAEFELIREQYLHPEWDDDGSEGP